MSYPGFNYITPEQAAELDVHNNGAGVKYYRKLAKQSGSCENCNNPVWKLGNTGMCFTCTTGESDASNDYELE